MFIPNEFDKAGCRPDFAVAVYPRYLLPEDTETDVLAPYIRIPAGTPPILLVHASDDPESGPEHSVAMYLALKRARVSAELHVYAAGGHGFGVRKTSQPVLYLDGSLCRLAAKPRGVDRAFCPIEALGQM